MRPDLAAVGLGLLLTEHIWHEFLVLGWPALGVLDDGLLVFLLLAIMPRMTLPMLKALAPVLVFGLVNAIALVGASDAFESARLLLPYLVCCLVGVALRSDAIERVLRIWCWVGLLACLYSLASYCWFRFVNDCQRAPASGLIEQILTFPYSTPVYPRGWRLAGTLLNDNYSAMLAAAQALLLVKLLGRWRWAAILPIVCFLFGFSRSAWVGLALALLFLFARRGWWVALVLLPLLFALSFQVGTYRDQYRFQHVMQTSGGRLQTLQRAGESLVKAPWGRGAGRMGLADVQFAKIAYETGWPGFLSFAAVIVAVLRAGLRAPRNSLKQFCTAAWLVILGGGVGADVLVVPQVACLFWTLSGVILNPGLPSDPRAPELASTQGPVSLLT
ncbi:MAG: hypothetical protein AMXMBFR33_46200 [Candidatus Xenobia bacterium]